MGPRVEVEGRKAIILKKSAETCQKIKLAVQNKPVENCLYSRLYASNSHPPRNCRNRTFMLLMVLWRVLTDKGLFSALRSPIISESLGIIKRLIPNTKVLQVPKLSKEAIKHTSRCHFSHWLSSHSLRHKIEATPVGAHKF
ncbi:hypothetical protein Pelo_9971 [Pelomyxa schiedti]|nr:hypothetical protein Pelo_9971 [Pelomyxa schiedti]